MAIHWAKSGSGRETCIPQRSSSWRHHQGTAPWNHPIAQTRASAYATRFFARGKGDNLTAEDLAYWVVNPEVKRRYIEAFAKSSILSIMAYYKANYSLSQFALNLFDPTMKKIYGAVIKCPVLHVHGIEESHALFKSWMEHPDNLTSKSFLELATSFSMKCPTILTRRFPPG
jgi:hypothetical protein